MAQAQWEVTWTYHSSSLSTHLGFERKRQSVEPVGAWCIWEQATYDDRLSSFSKALLLKYKTCADRLSSDRLLDMTNTKHDMKADGNTLQNPAEAQSMTALTTSQNTLEELRKMLPEVRVICDYFRRDFFHSSPQ